MEPYPRKNGMSYYKKTLPMEDTPILYYWSMQYIRNKSSSTWFTHSIYPSVSRWYVVLKFRHVSKEEFKVVQNLEVIQVSLSKIMVSRIPCSLKIYWTNFIANIGDPSFKLQGMKWETLVNLSTMTKMTSCMCRVMGKPCTKSMLITCHLYCRILWGYRRLAGWACWALTRWHFKH